MKDHHHHHHHDHEPHHHGMHEHYRSGALEVDWNELWEKQQIRESVAREWWNLGGGKPGLKVVDLGCGPGFFSFKYAEWGAEVLAVDLVAEALQALEKRRKGRFANTLNTACVDLEAGNSLSGNFDIAFITNVLHHIPDPGRVLTTLRANVRTLVVAEADPDGPGEVGPGREHRMSVKQMDELLTRAGWRPQRTIRQEFELYAIASI